MTRPEHDADEQVRRLLHDARHDEPVPEDVGARLDRVLAQLAAADGTDTAHTDEVAARRRRRAGGLLAAAVAVVVVGVGLGQAIDRDADEGAQDASSAGGTAGEAAERSEAAQDRGRAAESTLPRVKAPVPTGGPVDVSAERFTQDARAALRSSRRGVLGTFASAQDLYAASDRSSPAGRTGPERDARAGSSRGKAWFTCEAAAWGPGRLVAVRYDGEPAVLAARPPTGDIRVVEVLQCGTGAVLRSVTVPR